MLENIVQRAVVLARDEVIGAADLPLQLAELRSEDVPSSGSLVARLAAFERALLVQALAVAGGVQTRAARALGFGERHLRFRLKKHGLEGGSARSEPEE